MRIGKDTLQAWSARSRWGAALVCTGLLFSTLATADDVDAVLGAAPTLSAPAPVPVYAADVDTTRPEKTVTERGVIDAVAQQVECDVSTGGSTSLDFAGLILDRDSGDNLFIKVQGQDGSGKFSHIGFYHTLGTTGGWAGMTGGDAFFALAAGDEFASAHMIATHDGAGNVTLRLTNIDGGGKVLEFTRGGWTPRNSRSGGFGGFIGSFPVDNWGNGNPTDYICDNFDRANGGLGGNWVTTDGTASIVSDAARGNNNSRSIFIGSCGAGIGQQVEADVNLVSTSLDYCALVLNYDGSDNLYVKVQRQASAGTAFTHVGIYNSVNGGAWPGQTGGPAFFALPAGQTFSTAHMRVTVDGGGTVRLILTNLDGGSGLLEFQRGGWPFLNGNQAGFGGFANANRFDNWGTGGNVCDTFNRSNGPLGASWTTPDGTASIINSKARGDNTSRSIFVGSCGACQDTTPPVVSLTAPEGFSCACNSVAIVGSVGDPDGDYIGDILEYRPVNVNTWTQVASATGARTGTLYTWNTSAIPEGYYLVRVTGHNECNLSASDTTTVYISHSFNDAIMRSPPDGALLGGVVCFDGTAYQLATNSCFQNYSIMYKPLVGGAYAPVDPAFPVYTTPVINDPLGSWNTASGPTAVADGSYLVRLRGTSICGDIKDVIHTIVIDNTAPIATLSGALTCKSLPNGITQITGTASDANLSGWALQYTGGNQHGWVTIASGTTNVINGVLGNWDTTGLPPCAYTLRLVVADRAGVNCSGNTHETDYYAAVGIGWNLIGDMNCDGIVDFGDINAFVACLSNGGHCYCP